jgi:hypothetical protein
VRTDRPDLLLVAIGVVLHGALVLLPGLDGVPRALLGLPFVLVAPGYALQAAMLPYGQLGRAETVVLSVGLSLAVVALGGVALNLTTPGLAPRAWLLLIGSVTLAGCIAAGARWRSPSVTPFERWVPQRLDVLSLLAAAAMLTWAYALATAGAVEQRAGFTELWLRPANGSPVAAGPLRIGVRSMELERATFHVEVRGGDAVTFDVARLELGPGETWERGLPPPAMAQPVEAVLYREGFDGPYRRVRLAPPNDADTR